MAQRERFYFWHGYWNAMQKLRTYEQRGKLVSAMCEWAFDGTEPDFSDDPVLDFAWQVICEQIAESVEIGRDMARRGRRGGKASGTTRSTASSSGSTTASTEGKGTDQKGSNLPPSGDGVAPAADAAARRTDDDGLTIPPKPIGWD